MPARARRRGPREAHGRARGRAAGREDSRQAGELLLVVENLTVLDDRDLTALSTCLVRGQGGGDRGSRRRGRESERPHRRPHGSAEGGGGPDHRRWQRHDRRDRARVPRHGGRPHPRGPPGARPRARLHARREPGAPRLPEGARLEVGLALSAPPDPARRSAPEGVRRPRRAADRRRVALRRQPAEGRDRPGGLADPRILVAAQPTRGLDVGAIEFVHRRLVTERDEGRGSCSSPSSSRRSSRSRTGSSSSTRDRSSASTSQASRRRSSESR